MSDHKTSPSVWPLYLTTGVYFLLMCGLFGWLAMHRNVDGDEGLYLEAARLVAQGKKLYFDFFYQQMPLIPYLYAGWMEVFGYQLFSARFLSVLLTASAGLFTLAYVAKTTKNLWTLNFCAFFLFANGLILAWAPVIKTHPLNAFSLSLAVVALLLWRKDPRRRLAWAALAGFAIGIGVNGRLTLVPYLPFFAAYLWIHSHERPWRPLAAFAGAAALTFPLTLYYFALDPGLFYQYNLEYHTKIFPGISEDAFRLGIAQTVFVEMQMFLLSILFLLGVWRAARRGWKEFFLSDEAFLAAAVGGFLLIHLMTATPFTQYFSAVVPLLVIGIAPVLQAGFARRRALCVAALVFAAFFYASAAKRVMNHEINSMGSDHSHWELRRISRAVRAAKRYLRPGEPCLTWWPGYAFLAGCPSAEGMENHMRSHAIDVGIPGDVLETYKMMSDERLLETLADRRYRVLIAGVYRLGSPYYRDIDRAILDNYRPARTEAGVTIYVAKDLTDDIVDRYILEREIRYRKR